MTDEDGDGAPAAAASIGDALFPRRLETERLVLERLCRETVDVPAYYELCSRRNPNVEAVTRYRPWKPHETVKETADYVVGLERKWDEGTRAEYLLRPKPGEDGAGEVAGSAALILEWETRTAYPGIWLRERFWGRGYSGERAAALVEVAFERLDLDLVAVPVEDGNEKSRAAVEKYVERFGGGYDGLVRNATARPDGRIVDRHRYTVTREQYEEATARVEGPGAPDRV